MGIMGTILFIIALLMLVDIKWKQEKMLVRMDKNNELLANILKTLNQECKQEDKNDSDGSV